MALRARVLREQADALGEKRAGKEAWTSVPTFGQAADDYVAAHQVWWKSAAYRAQWKNSLSTYCAPIRDLPGRSDRHRGGAEGAAADMDPDNHYPTDTISG
jgi:hypothetical protein